MFAVTRAGSRGVGFRMQEGVQGLDTRKVSPGAGGQMWGREERRRAPKSPRAHKKMASRYHIRAFGDTRPSDVCPLHLSAGSRSNKLVSYQLLRAVNFLIL